MKTFRIETIVTSLSETELTEEERAVVNAAKMATDNSYAPYSKFHVGAAVLLDNGEIIKGSNQENAAYPSGICAERTTIFYANSEYPDEKIKYMAIAAKSENGFTPAPISPCGTCRQVLLETERRYGQDIKVLLYSTDGIYRVDSMAKLLPLSFTEESLTNE